MTVALCCVRDKRMLSEGKDHVGSQDAQVVQATREAGRLAATLDELRPELLSCQVLAAEAEGPADA